MIRKLLLLLFVPLFLQASDFAKLMGRTKCWKYLKTKEDRELLQLFKTSYEKRLRVPGEAVLIPEIIHLIWLGPRNYPEDSVKKLNSWVTHHPKWKIKLWTDRPRNINVPGVEISIIDASFLGENRDLFEESDNWGEKSDILRLVILQKEGGLYVDHDVVCKKSFQDFHHSYDFYASLMFPSKSMKLVIHNSIIGARPNHEILASTLGLMRKKWKEAREKFPGNDVTSLLQRVGARSFTMFGKAVLGALPDPNFSGIVFPAGYFFESRGRFGTYAHEENGGTWFKEEMTSNEKYLTKKLLKLQKRLRQFMTLAAIYTIANILFLALLLIYIYRRTRATYQA